MPPTQYNIICQINEKWWNVNFSWNCYRLLLEIAVIHDMVKNDWINNNNIIIIIIIIIILRWLLKLCPLKAQVA